MRLSAILLARALGFIEVFDLDPHGKIFLPKIVPELVKRYDFQKFPSSPADLDETKGIEFLDGRHGDKVIQKFVIWNSLLVLETRSNTKDSKEILEDMLEWGAQKLGLSYRPGQIRRFAFVSDLSFFSDAPLLTPSVAVANLADRTSKLLSNLWLEPIRYEPLIITIGHDPSARKNAIASFTIQRRVEAPFSEKKYFSEAPLSTNEHLKLLEQYEEDVSAEKANLRDQVSQG